MAKSTKVSDLIGKTVATSEGNIIGEVNEVIIDTDTWRATNLQLKIEKSTGKEMGLKTPFLGSLLVLVETVRVTSAADQIIIDVPIDGFKEYVDGRSSDEEE
jgi:sporulation protein YlmC with PRC-barrel domain